MRTKTVEPITAEKLAGCGRCQKCSRGCPGHIDIPAMLEIYCKFQTGEKAALRPIKDFQKQGLPIDCIECGACTDHCPRHFDVRAAVKELATQSMMQ
ncbi:MAG: 4Fe-4S dicluster domain-containing protein [Acutalibacter muris]|nr:4Fe-4S dicluster domain-containing protein [Acutalibacter muris]